MPVSLCYLLPRLLAKSGAHGVPGNPCMDVPVPVCIPHLAVPLFVGAISSASRTQSQLREPRGLTTPRITFVCTHSTTCLLTSLLT